jgi:aspartyl-tRNA(Asn)/glutamyl-tRNA(Gln) amidotransferase subunit A
MARSAADCAVLLNAMAGFDSRESTSLERPAEDFTRGFARQQDRPLQGLRIGVPREFFGEGLAADVHGCVMSGLERMRELGAALIDISLPKTELSIPAYYVIAPAEASSNLSRFDGVRYGHRAGEYRDLDEMYRRTRTEGFGDEVKRRILIGAYVLSHGYYDAYYLQAQKLRRLIADDFRLAFDSVDLIAGPVAPTVAWNLGERIDDPVRNYLADIYTLPASLAGLPALSMPAGFGEAGRPVGLQLIGSWLDEARLLDAAYRFQQVSDWHLRMPA